MKNWNQEKVSYSKGTLIHCPAKIYSQTRDIKAEGRVEHRILNFRISASIYRCVFSNNWESLVDVV